jgi:asparagine synthase (glutamine-hydrolysing)
LQQWAPQQYTSTVMVSSRCAVVFEGQLEGATPGHAGNSERVIESYRRWEQECVAHLRGQFSFILWDGNRRRLLTACDPTGSRSLAYFFNKRTLLIASRALSLLRHPSVRPRFDPVYFAHVFGEYWAQPPGLTAFIDVRRTRPGVALVLENGRLSERSAATFASRSSGAARAEQAYDEFWRLLRAATRSRFEGSNESCLSLSGGLDSMFVGAALASHAAEHHAFSLVSKTRPDLDETPAIRAFCAQHPLVRWHPVACDLEPAWALPPALPLVADDPIVTADPLRPARIRLMMHMREYGFRSALDGEGGDELFGMSRRLGDFVALGHWLSLAKVLATQKRRRASLWTGLVVPRLPPWVRSVWNLRRYRRSSETLPWMTKQFWGDDATREAREQAGSWLTVDRSLAAFTRIVEHPGNVASKTAQRLAAACLGLELQSPMLDPTIIEFVLGLPPELLWTSPESKPFLRAAGQGRLPREVLQREKDVALFELMRHRALADREVQDVIGPLLASCELLVDRVDPRIVLDYLRRAGQGDRLSDRQASALYSTVATARWMGRVISEYRVR